MPKVRVAFHKVLQNTQNYHSFDKKADHMVSTLFFSLEVGGRHYPDLRVEIRHPFGTDFKLEPVEVAKPVGSYVGPWNHAAFRDLCEKCYRKAVGAEGSGIRITGGKDVRMWDNVIGRHLFRRVRGARVRRGELVALTEAAVFRDAVVLPPSTREIASPNRYEESPSHLLNVASTSHCASVRRS